MSSKLEIAKNNFKNALEKLEGLIEQKLHDINNLKAQIKQQSHTEIHEEFTSNAAQNNILTNETYKADTQYTTPELSTKTTKNVQLSLKELKKLAGN